MKNLFSVFVCVFAFLVVSSPAVADEFEEATEVVETRSSGPEKNGKFGFVEVQGFYDFRDLSNITVNILGKLPHRFTYFSFVNYFTALNTANNVEFETFYTEQHLSWNPYEPLPLDLVAHLSLSSGPRNDTLRFGVGWRISDTPGVKYFFEKLNLRYKINFNLAQIELSSRPGWGMQIEHVYHWNLLPSVLKNRFYLKGFADHNLTFGNGSNRNSLVMEHQFGFRLFNHLYAITEIRYNDFMPERFGVGVGLEYKIQY